jgi:hypothetical protein
MAIKRSLVGAVAFAFVVIMSAAQAADLKPVLKAPAAEPQQATGYVEVYGGGAWTRLTETECESGDPCDPALTFKFNGWALGGAGRANYWVNRDVSVQLDAQAEGTSYDFPSNVGPFAGHFSNHSYLVGGHVSWRDPARYLFGLFAAAGDAGGGFFSFGAQRHGVFGAEAQWYWQQFTLYLQGGYDTTLGNVGFGIDDINAWFIRATGRYFVTSNLVVEATGLYANGDINSDSSGFLLGSASFETWLWQAKVEYRFPTAPFSIFAKYQGSETRYDTLNVFFGTIDTKMTDHRVLFGVKLNMGDRSLQGTDRGGATLDILDPFSTPTSPLMFSPFGGGVT